MFAPPAMDSRDDHDADRVSLSQIRFAHIPLHPDSWTYPVTQDGSASGRSSPGDSTQPAMARSAETARHSTANCPGTPDIHGVPLEKPKHRAASSIRDWWWEIGGAALSLSFTIIIAGILLGFDGRAVSNWRFLISPNALIAVFATLTRAALMVPVASCISQLKWIHFTKSPRPLSDMDTFDAASRGPWGALALVWKLNLQTKLATWGSVITVIALAMSPFTQQILSFPSREKSIPGNAFVDAVQTYDSGLPREQVDVGALMVDTQMQGAILNGLYNVNSPVHFQCSTGNCYWPNVTTLAVTSKCINVTSHSAIQCTSGRSQRCNYTTPSGFILGGSGGSSPGGTARTYFNATAAEMSYEKSATGAIVDSTLAHFATANFTAKYVGGACVTDDCFGLKTPDLAECTISWCARTYHNITVSNGVFQPGPSTDYPLDGVSSSPNPDAWNSFTVVSSDASFAGTNRTFAVSPVDNSGIAGYLRAVFSSPAESPYGFGVTLYRSSSIADTVARIATSMTYALGSAASSTNSTNTTAATANSATATTTTTNPSSAASASTRGFHVITEQYIRVHWAWLALPIIEVLMGLAFLAATLLYTRGAGVAAWKSSATAPFLARLDGWRRDELRTGSLKEVGATAKRMRGLFGRGEADALAFVRTGGMGLGVCARAR